LRFTHLFAGVPVSAVDDLAERPTEPGPGGLRTTVLDDPDGNRIKLFEDPSA
jgi:hypothetical protein